MTLLQKVHYIGFCVRQNCVNTDLAKSFLKVLAKDDNLFDGFILATYKDLFQFFDVLKDDPYKLGLEPGFIDYLIEKYIKLLAYPDFSSPKFNRVELLS